MGWSRCKLGCLTVGFSSKSAVELPNQALRIVLSRDFSVAFVSEYVRRVLYRAERRWVVYDTKGDHSGACAGGRFYGEWEWGGAPSAKVALTVYQWSYYWQIRKLDNATVFSLGENMCVWIRTRSTNPYLFPKDLIQYFNASMDIQYHLDPHNKDHLPKSQGRWDTNTFAHLMHGISLRMFSRADLENCLPLYVSQLCKRYHDPSSSSSLSSDEVSLSPISHLPPLILYPRPLLHDLNKSIDNTTSLFAKTPINRNPYSVLYTQLMASRP